MKLKCPKCGKGLNIPERLYGKRGRCPECKEIIDIPAEDVEELEADAEEAIQTYSKDDEVIEKETSPAPPDITPSQPIHTTNTPLPTTSTVKPKLPPAEYHKADASPESKYIRLKEKRYYDNIERYYYAKYINDKYSHLQEPKDYAKVERHCADLGRRLSADVIDVIFPILFFALGIRLLWIIFGDNIHNDIISNIIVIVFLIILVAPLPLYYLLKDGAGGRSFGKRLMKLIVVSNMTGKPIGFYKSFIRNLPFWLPFCRFIIILQLLSKEPQRIGDGWADTIVMDLDKYESGGKASYCCDGALQVFTKVINSKSVSADAYFVRGLIYYLMNDIDSAFQDYNQAISLKPDQAEYICVRGYAFNNNGDNERAFQDYNKAIDLKPDYASTYFLRGNAFKDKGCIDKANEDYAKAIKLGYKIY